VAFPSTRWTRIRMANNPEDPEARKALHELFRSYQEPILAYIRWFERDSAEDPADLLQGVFLSLLNSGFGGVDPSKGRFRTWLKAVARHHLLARKAERERTLAVVSFEGDEADDTGLLTVIASDGPSPADQFDRLWAQTVLDRGMAQLELSKIVLNNPTRFARVRHLVLDPVDRDSEYEQIARELNEEVGTIKVHIHRLRNQFGALVRAEIEELVEHTADVDAEIDFLLAALTSSR